MQQLERPGETPGDANMNPFIILSVLGGLFLIAKKSQPVASVVVPTMPTSTPTPIAPPIKPSTSNSVTITIKPDNYPSKVAAAAFAAGNIHDQAVFLRDLGYTRTADALEDYTGGMISKETVLEVARSDTGGKPPASTTTMQTSTNAVDTFCDGLMNAKDVDTLYSYASTSNSIPCVRKAADLMASLGDTRAAELTARLALMTSK